MIIHTISKIRRLQLPSGIQTKSLQPNDRPTVRDPWPALYIPELKIQL